jgi:hypothetical protein
LATTPCCVIKRGRAAEIRAGRPCNCNSGCLRRSGLLCSEELQGLPVTSGRIHLQRRMRPLASMAGLRPLGWRKLKPAWRAPSGFAAIPTSALDPAHRPASPAVPRFRVRVPIIDSRLTEELRALAASRLRGGNWLREACVGEAAAQMSKLSRTASCVTKPRTG